MNKESTLVKIDITDQMDWGNTFIVKMPFGKVLDFFYSSAFIGLTVYTKDKGNIIEREFVIADINDTIPFGFIDVCPVKAGFGTSPYLFENEEKLAKSVMKSMIFSVKGAV